MLRAVIDLTELNEKIKKIEDKKIKQELMEKYLEALTLFNQIYLKLLLLEKRGLKK